MKLDLSKVCFSRNDIKFGIRVPKILDKELAYFIGIQIGDGSLGNYKGGKYCIEYNGHLVDEKDFYSKDFKELFKRLFNKDINVKQFVKGLADSDFCLSFKSKNNKLNNIPSISIGSYSTKLIREVNAELKK